MRSYFVSLSLSLLFVVAVVSISAETTQSWQSGPKRVTLVELYTSEGCSSCPPAEKWLGKWQNSKHLWDKVVPIAFHVTYWDYLGWQDPLARKEFSQRQRQYASSWRPNRGSVYTPGFVVNGKEWRGWFQGQELPASSARVGKLQVERQQSGSYQVRFSPSQALQNKVNHWQAHAVLLGSGIVSKIKAGENTGRTLKHHFVALSLPQTISLKQQEKSVVGSFSLTWNNKVSAKEYHIALWITPKGKLLPIQALGGDIQRETNK